MITNCLVDDSDTWKTIHNLYDSGGHKVKMFFLLTESAENKTEKRTRGGREAKYQTRQERTILNG